MFAYYSDRFVLPLPEGHRFPMAKYRALRDRVQTELSEVRLAEPEAASPVQLVKAHDANYVERVLSGNLSAAEIRAIGFPWSPQMVERSLRSVGATIGACRAALHDGVGVNLAGGTHHAKRDRGAGYCVFNDAAVAVRVLQDDAACGVTRVAIVDLDVHQGDGTAQIFHDDPSVFTLSLHGATNFPNRKETSDLDIALPDGTADDGYLRALDDALSELAVRFQPDLLVYVAGADAHANDRLGRLALSEVGMAERDARVFAFAGEAAVPVVVTMAGGYGRDIATTVAVHFRTVAAAYDLWVARQQPRLASVERAATHG